MRFYKEKSQVIGLSALKAHKLFDYGTTVSVLDRNMAETNVNYRHIIPYVAVKFQNQLAVYPRTGSEKRLHALFSIGFGGHVDVKDVVLSTPHNEKSMFSTYIKKTSNIDVVATIRKALDREMLEEIGLTVEYIKQFEPIILNSTAVDSVHLGVPYLTIVSAKKMLTKSDEITNILWKTKEELLCMEKEALLENWSINLLHQLIEANCF